LKDLELSPLHPSFSELEQATVYARMKKISVYDASYVVLAQKLGCELITADKRVARAVNEPFVKML